MPNIHTYEPRVSPQPGGVGGVSQLRPNELGINASEQTARTLGRLASEESGQLEGVGRGMVRAAEAHATALRDVARGAIDLGNAVGGIVAKHQENQEVTKFYADFAALGDGLTRKWMETRNASDPNDPGVSEKFNQEVLAPALEKFTAGFSTERGKLMAEQESGRLTEHLLTQQKADMSTAAGEAAVLNATKFSNISADHLRTDPTAFDFVQDSTKAMVANLKTNPNLTAEMSAHLDTLGETMLRNNAKAAFVGMADKNPAAARAALDAGFGKEYLSEEDRLTLDNHAKSVAQYGETQDRAREAEQRRQNTDQNNAAADHIYANAIQTDGSFTPGPDYFESIKKLSENPDVAPGLLRSMYDAGNRALREPPIQHSDPDLLQHFNDQAVLPTGNPDVLTFQKVFDAQGRGLLSDKDANRLRTEITEMAKDPQRQEAFKQYQEWAGAQRAVIVRPAIMGLPASPDQYRKWGDFQIATRQAFASAYASGNWRQLLDPTNASYLGKVLPDYAGNAGKDALRGLDKSPGTVTTEPETPAASPAKANPNETPEDYLKRGG